MGESHQRLVKFRWPKCTFIQSHCRNAYAVCYNCADYGNGDGIDIVNTNVIAIAIAIALALHFANVHAISETAK